MGGCVGDSTDRLDRYAPADEHGESENHRRNCRAPIEEWTCSAPRPFRPPRKLCHSPLSPTIPLPSSEATEPRET